MANPIDISNVVTISVSEAPAGLSDFQVNNLLILTRETAVVSPGNFGVYLNPTDVGTDWGTSSEVYAMANLIFSQQPNIITGGGSLLIAHQGPSGTESLAQAIARLEPLVFFGGVLWAGYAPTDGEILAAGAVVQPLRKMLFASSYLAASVDTGEIFDDVKAAGYTYVRCLLYTVSAQSARYMAAAYAGRAMSTNFSGSLTTATMHMKELVGVLPDPNITQTNLDKCETVGADVYINIGGLSKVFCTGGNTYYDSVYNLTWLVFALQVAGFNAIATTSTKLPQTETGMAVLRGAYLNVLTQAVVNGYSAPGTWNGAIPFGSPAVFSRNVAQLGFYLYSSPVSTQSQADRLARKAPLVQIAVKEAGAIQSSSVIVNVQA
jgi:hypothetical protein